MKVKALVAATVLARAEWREGELAERLDTVGQSALERISKYGWVDPDFERAISRAAFKMRDALERRT